MPEKNLETLREAVCRAGAGKIGDYTQCSFSFDGEGTFFGGESTKPVVGRAGQLERSREKRFEVVFPWKALGEVVAAARSAHPYEEMAYDVLELAQPARPLGYGFVGKYAGIHNKAAPMDAGEVEPLAFHKLLDNVKQIFQLSSVTVAGPGLADSKMRVQNLAFSPGSGSSFVSAASAKGADVYVCGEIGYHQMLEARQKGMTLVMLGHSYSERFFVETVAEWCEAVGPVRKVFETVHETK
ncbi:MAG: Nif3-like dinuclear metal center hexameric protein [Deltaproteobacteria bacterium]|nr:Nif3-like dinuclear metal center hexameric protein [Deltaproteobacteria bacterium]